MKNQYGQNVGDKSCQSNFDKRLSDFGFEQEFQICKKILNLTLNHQKSSTDQMGESRF